MAAAKTDGGQYYCVFCSKLFEKWAMDIDHVDGCGPLTDYSHVEGFVRNLIDGKLIAMCKPCHKAKTKSQRRSK